MSGEKDRSKILRPLSASTQDLLRALNAKLNNLNLGIVSENSSFKLIPLRVESEGFPFVLPDKVYTSVTIVVPPGETVEMDGVELPEGLVFSGSGNGTQKVDSFTLSNPSGTPSGVFLFLSK
jgi:hypothetical protein